jgi:hypothetical protein
MSNEWVHTIEKLHIGIDNGWYCGIFKGCVAPIVLHCSNCPLDKPHNLELSKMSNEEIIDAVNIHILLD